MAPLFLLKGLSFLPFGSFLKNPKVLIGGILIIALVFVYFKWKNNIIERVENEIYTEQAEALLEQQKREFETQQRLQEEAARHTQRLAQQRETLIRDIERLRGDVRSSAAEDDGDVAPVLANVIEAIRAREGTLTKPAAAPTLGERTDALLEDGADAVDELRETGNSAIDEWRKKLKRLGS